MTRLSQIYPPFAHGLPNRPSQKIARGQEPFTQFTQFTQYSSGGVCVRTRSRHRTRARAQPPAPYRQNLGKLGKSGKRPALSGGLPFTHLSQSWVNRWVNRYGEVI